MWDIRARLPGHWLAMVWLKEHFYGVQGVEGSNPFIPTRKSQKLKGVTVKAVTPFSIMYHLLCQICARFFSEAQ